MEFALFACRTIKLALPLVLLAFSSTAGELAIPLGLPALPLPFRSNPRRAAIGRELFFDRRLSVDGTVSCGTCHIPDHAFTDGRTLSVGNRGLVGTRNVPSLFNVAFATTLFWDGRATELESQAKLPLLNEREHGLASEAALLSTVETDPTYRKQFARAFGGTGITVEVVMTALATYERTLLAGDSPFDHYQYGGDRHAITDAAIRGLEFFRGRAGCAGCHVIGKTSALFTDQEFHGSPTGLPASVNETLVELTQRVTELQRHGDPNDLNMLIMSNSNIASLGRFVVTKNPSDIGLFRTPSLRNVAATAPYLHDGSIATLEEVVATELYSRGDAVRFPIVATTGERADLVEFLKALSSP